MPRRKAQAQPFSPGTETSLANGEASTPADFGAAEPSKAAAAATATNASSRMIHKQMKLEGIEAYELPKAVLARVAKAELPENVQIRREALLAISKSASIFISYLAAVSDELAKQANRKAITPNDVVEGLSLMEFPESVRTQLKREIRDFRELEGRKKDAASARKAAANAGDASMAESGAGEAETEDCDDEEAAAAQRTKARRHPVLAPASGSDSLVGEDDGERLFEKDTNIEQSPARLAGELDPDEEDENRERKMAEEGAQEGNLDDQE